MKQDIYKQLRSARLDKKLTQQQLARWADVTQARVSRIEAGGEDIRLSTLARLADALDLSVLLVPRALANAIDQHEAGGLQKRSGSLEHASDRGGSNDADDDENIWLRKYSESDQ